MKTEKTIWKLDPTHSEITFKVKHLMISNVKGAFKSFQAEVEGDDFAEAKVQVNIDAGSVDTNNEDRANYLKSAHFFDIEHYKDMQFEGSTLQKVASGQYTLTGYLTIKDVRKPVQFDVEFGGINQDPWGNRKAGFSLEGKINRKDWGLNWNAALETGGVLVSDDVRIQAEVQFVKQAA